MVRNWNRLNRRLGDVPFSETACAEQPDLDVDALVHCKGVGHGHGRWSSKAPSNSNVSMILWGFCDHFNKIHSMMLMIWNALCYGFWRIRVGFGEKHVLTVQATVIFCFALWL